MTTREKPILHYTETIVNLYPEELWDSLQELSEECEKIDPDSHFRKAFDSVIEKVYREGGSLTPKIRKRARKRCKRLIFLSNFWFLYCVFWRLLV